MKVLIALAALVAVAYSHAHGTPPKQTAYFDSDGLTGWITVDAGQVMVNLDWTNFHSWPAGTNKATCTSSGLSFHIHEMWHSSLASVNSSVMCGSNMTGGHWDPWAACGPASGNPNCAKNTGGCITRGFGQTGGYACNLAAYLANPISACEVGDWSGKYGALAIGVNNQTIFSSRDALTGTAAGKWNEIQLYEPSAGHGVSLVGKSVVLHCTGGTPAAQRVVCAQFHELPSHLNTSYVPKLPQSFSTRLVADFGKIQYGPALFLDGSDLSFVTAGNNGSTQLPCTLKGAGTTMVQIMNTIPTTMTGAMEGATACSNLALGGMYDPGYSCGPNSQYSPAGGMTSNSVCTDVGAGGTVTKCHGTASANLFNYTSMSANNFFYASWGDLQTLYHGGSVQSQMAIPYANLVGKSVLIQCGNGYRMCAPLKLAPQNYVKDTFTSSANALTTSFVLFACLFIHALFL